MPRAALAPGEVPEHGDGSQEVADVEGELFPLEVGKTMRMRVTGSGTRFPEGWEVARTCEVVAEERVTVPAGTYDMFKIVCRQGKRTYTWYYAPEIAHPVFYLNRHADLGGSPQQLVRYERAGVS